MSWRIPLSEIDLGPEEQSAIQDVLAREWLTMGEVTQKFEAAFAQMTGAKYALAVTNATAGLHMACMTLGLKPGDEVIVPSLTFVASANCIRYTGAQPIFADITSETNLNISPEAIERAITDRTRAILVVHYGGYACDMPAILAIAQRHGLHVIEDAAHAAGAWLEDRHLGSWGHIGCFSFFSNKNMTTGEGGMLLTNEDELFHKLSLLRSHGMTSLTLDRHKGHAWSYDVVDLGYNYRIDEMRSALGTVQLSKLERNNSRRRHLVDLYRSCLEELPQITIPFPNHPGITSAHIQPILLPPHADRVAFMERMKAQGIQTSIHYPPIHRFTAYRDVDPGAAARLPVTSEVAAREVTLPLYPRMTDDDVMAVTEAIADALLPETPTA